MLRDKQTCVCENIIYGVKKINDTADEKSSYSLLFFLTPSDKAFYT